MLHGSLVAADDQRKEATIGQLWFSNSSTAKPFDDAFRLGLKDFGYTEGKNTRIVPRYAEGNDRQVSTLLRELIAMPVDVLLVSPAAMAAAKQLTTTVPIVCATMGDPVERGLVASLARPSGNLTGLANQRADTDPKRLELAMELVPQLHRMGLLFETYPNATNDIDRFRVIARKLDITVQTYEVRNLKDIEQSLNSISRDRPDVLTVWSSALLTLHRRTIFKVSTDRVPVISDAREYAEAGALLTYAPSGYEMYRLSAAYVDNILKGAKPSDLPIEQPTKFELVVNQKTAEALGVTIPRSILLRADEVLK